MEANYFTIFYWFCHTSTWICHRCTCFPYPEPPPTSLPIPSLWIIPVHQPQASCIMHRTWTGDSFHIWYYTCFNAILPNHPTLSLSDRVQKTVLYTCVSLTVSQGLVHWDDPEGWYGEGGGRGCRMGNTCTPTVDSCWCMAKPIQYCKVTSLQLK